MNIESSIGTITMIQCPDCIAMPCSWYPCHRCGGKRWINKPPGKDFQITINPAPNTFAPIYKIDPELRAFLTCLEEKLDRLLAETEAK